MAADRRPNVLLMHCHDIGQFVGCYGVPTVQTPSLDAFAADSVRFANAFCTAPQCSPSRAALFTGRYPHNTGVLGLTHGGFAWDMNADVEHLAALLGDAGYWTELVGVHHESRKLADDAVAAQLGFDRVDTGGRADQVADRSIEALKARTHDADRPFYLQVGFIEPHRLGPPTEGGTRMGFVGDYIEPDASLGVTVPGYLCDDESTRAEVAELQGAVRYMDAAVGRILAKVEELGLAEDTIVIFTTDHGLALPRAKLTLYDPGLETVLIVRAPGLGWTGGRVVDDLVSNIDVVPTLLDAIGVSIPDAVQGQSVVSLLNGSQDAAGREFVFGEFTFHNYYDPRRCVRTRSHKLIVKFDSAPAFMATVSQSWRPWSTPVVSANGPANNHAPVELYDLENDPWELTNLADDAAYGRVLDQLRQQLLAWMEDTDDPLLRGLPASPAYHAGRDFLHQSHGGHSLVAEEQ